MTEYYQPRSDDHAPIEIWAFDDEGNLDHQLCRMCAGPITDEPHVCPNR